MATPLIPVAENGREDELDSRFRCGKLLYTRAGLFSLFAWLLWGDFCFTLMEAIWPNLLPLMLNRQGASNFLLSVFMTTIPSLLNLVMNPIVSTASDRYRSRRGRRIPFLLAGTPFIALFLGLLGFSEPLGRSLHHLLTATFSSLSVSGVTIGIICCLIIAFRLCELFVNTVFWYLFNDVVPVAFMGRFLGLFRVVGSLAGALFHFFLFQRAATHTALIFVSVALLYGSAFMAMSLKVKEGPYPPPEPITAEGPAVWAYVKTFVEQCCGHRVFRLVFIYSAMVGFQGAIGAFVILMALSLGLTMADVGTINGAGALVAALLMYPMGWLIDRFHPVRVLLAAQVGYCAATSINLLFLFFAFSATATFWIYALGVALALPFATALTAAALPLLMRIFPPDRFGQFCAANAMCGAAGSIAGGALAGGFLDLMKTTFHRADYYRFVPVWTIFFVVLGAGASHLLFREWSRLGGDQHYSPPGVHLD